jgi:hypothetical protein
MPAWHALVHFQHNSPAAFSFTRSDEGFITALTKGYLKVAPLVKFNMLSQNKIV